MLSESIMMNWLGVNNYAVHIEDYGLYHLDVGL
jgi:hypothetical protein